MSAGPGRSHSEHDQPLHSEQTKPRNLLFCEKSEKVQMYYSTEVLHNFQKGGGYSLYNEIAIDYWYVWG